MSEQSQATFDPSESWKIKPVNVGLFILTTVSTLLAGLEMAGAAILWPGELDLSADVWIAGLMYCVPVMVILTAHEFGHFFQAKRHGVAATPPFYLPGVPIPGLGWMPLFGTFGAFIKMTVGRVRGVSMLQIAAWGPLAGWVLSIPALLVGIAISPVEPVPEGANSMGYTLAILLGEWLFHPNIPEGHDVMLHPLGMAGWFGCFLTSLNLLPVGQLDGGHIAYVWMGRWWNRVAPWVFGGLIVLGVVAWMGWLIFAGLVYFLGIKHPDIVVDTPVRGRDSWLGWASIVMFATTFTIAPFEGGSLIELVLMLVNSST